MRRGQEGGCRPTRESVPGRQVQNSLVDNGSNESETKRGLRCFALRRVIGRSCKQCNRHEFMKDQGWQVMVMVSRSRHGQMAKMAQVKPSSVGTQAERRQERRHNQGTNICRKPSSVGTKAERRHNEGTTKAQISVAVMSHYNDEAILLLSRKIFIK